MLRRCLGFNALFVRLKVSGLGLLELTRWFELQAHFTEYLGHCEPLGQKEAMKQLHMLLYCYNNLVQ